MTNSLGTLFKITTWGESHGPALGVVIDGCPAGFKIDLKQLQKEMDRRKPGQSVLVTERKESDVVEIMSGLFEGKTTGAPISMIIRNEDQQSKAYEKIKNKYRPSHADFTYQAKYGIRDERGGGRASARETAARVASGALAKQILLKKHGLEILAYVRQIHEIEAKVNLETLQITEIEKSLVRCPDPQATQKMMKLIEKMKKEGDSVGGVIECVVRKVPAGLGSPVFDKLEARLAQAMLSIPACRAFEIGSGFAGVRMKGSEHTDGLRKAKERGKDRIITLTNHAGGIVGGITNGMDIIFRVAFKAPASIQKKQETVTKKGQKTSIEISGRHDPCVLPRAVPIVEAMAALVLMDEALKQKIVRF